MESPLSFLDTIISQNRKTTRTEVKLNTISAFIDWDALHAEVNQLFPVSKLGGRPAEDLLVKTKMLFIQHLYNFSDPELEDQMNDRLSFQRFCGISMSETIIDFTTFWSRTYAKYCNL